MSERNDWGHDAQHYHKDTLPERGLDNCKRCGKTPTLIDMQGHINQMTYVCFCEPDDRDDKKKLAREEWNKKNA